MELVLNRLYVLARISEFIELLENLIFQELQFLEHCIIHIRNPIADPFNLFFDLMEFSF